MNKKRREAIAQLVKDMEGSRNDLENLIDEEQEAYDNLPEPLQSSMKGDEMNDCIDCMNDAMSSLDDSLSYLGDLC